MWVKAKNGALINLGASNCMGVAIPDRTSDPGIYALRAVFSSGNITIWRGSEGACWEVHDGIENMLGVEMDRVLVLEQFVTPAEPDQVETAGLLHQGRVSVTFQSDDVEGAPA